MPHEAGETVVHSLDGQVPCEDAMTDSVSPMAIGLADYTLGDLEALAQERPELGRLEVTDGALHATGGSAVGNHHQLVWQRLHLLFAAACPATHLLRLDTWWLSPRAVLEILCNDAHHGLVRKDAVDAEFGVTRRGYLDPTQRHGWWWRADDQDHRQPVVG